MLLQSEASVLVRPTEALAIAALVMARRPAARLTEDSRIIRETNKETTMATKQEGSETTATAVAKPTDPRQYLSRWRTAEQRANGLRAKKQRRRASHRVALKRSHANG